MILWGGGLFAGANFFHLVLVTPSGRARGDEPKFSEQEKLLLCKELLLSSLGRFVSHCSVMQITWEVMQGKSLGNTVYSLIYSNLWRIILHNHDITIWDKKVFCSQCFSTYLKGDLNAAKQC